jgi:hypothetical protein
VSRRALLAVLVLAASLSACAGGVDGPQPGCDSRNSLFILVAQAVPSATVLPCVVAYPEGWSFGGSRTASGEFRFFLDSDRAGFHAVEVTLTAGCDRSSAVEVVPAPDEAGTRRFEEPIELPPNFRANRYYTFPGGCITVRYRFTGTADPALVLQADQALGFARRSLVIHALREIDDLTLCGAEAPPCAGGTAGTP